MDNNFIIYLLIYIAVITTITLLYTIRNSKRRFVPRKHNGYHNRDNRNFNNRRFNRNNYQNNDNNQQSTDND